MSKQSVNISASPISLSIITVAIGVFVHITNNALYLGSIAAPFLSLIWGLITISMIIGAVALERAVNSSTYAVNAVKSTTKNRQIETLLTYMLAFGGAAAMYFMGWVWTSAFMATFGFSFALLHWSIFNAKKNVDI